MFVKHVTLGSNNLCGKVPDSVDSLINFGLHDLVIVCLEIYYCFTRKVANTCGYLIFWDSTSLWKYNSLFGLDN